MSPGNAAGPRTQRIPGRGVAPGSVVMLGVLRTWAAAV